LFGGHSLDARKFKGEAASKNSVRDMRYQQNFLLYNNNEITACIEDLFNSCSEEV